MNGKNQLLVGAIVAGLMTGGMALANNDQPTAPTPVAGDKDHCSGKDGDKNHCKGMNKDKNKKGKKDKNHCKGKDHCAGKDGCKGKDTE
jgi:hypothetical protein